jgi:hemerythrin
MASGQWDEHYNVGVKEIDEQRQRLFNLFFILFEDEDVSQNPFKIADTLANLNACVHEHFSTEEKYLAECGYPGLEKHIHLHDAFLKKMGDLCSNYRVINHENLMGFLRYLYGWLINHVSICDQQYVPYITKQATLASAVSKK